ncbi:MAG: DedA family protein [Porticoccaceae bacterium]|nr:DedA family protein [Porticoccaceae bacterium]
MLFCRIGPRRVFIDDLIINWLNLCRHHAWILVLGLAFLEACPGVGLFTSGAILLSICTLLFSEQWMSLWLMLPLAFSGACLSDHLGFYLGRWLGPKFQDTEFAQKRATQLQRGEAFIVKYGTYSVLLGRLVPAVRSIVPLLVGAAGTRPVKFTLLDILACALWSAGLGLLVLGLDSLI